MVISSPVVSVTGGSKTSKATTTVRLLTIALSENVIFCLALCKFWKGNVVNLHNARQLGGIVEPTDCSERYLVLKQVRF